MMTPDQISYYLSVCEREAPDTIETLKEVYSQPNYHVSWELAAAEVGYWHEHRRIEPYFQCLQSVEEVNGGLIYVHKDPARLQ